MYIYIILYICIYIYVRCIFDHPIFHEIEMSVLVGFHMISPSGSKVEPPPALPVTGIGLSKIHAMAAKLAKELGAKASLEDMMGMDGNGWQSSH